ncbi:hypothetical protein [Evansella tamaricis]|uniref:Uncharacterized protein n=1 Tax=Evansella tamaricis TaxID=2069301 RepID=A0ABS6JMM5_9BACI|nr:hypothetical protein [Evansella tamaricis]MBU9714836.1 hypothetical protein [Evansella tamaricis]
MPYRDKRQYQVTSGALKNSGVEATYDYTSGNSTSKRKPNKNKINTRP